MLKRVVVVGQTGDFLAALSDQAKGKDIEIAAVNSIADVPPATSAVVAAADQSRVLIEAAQALGAQQEQILELLAEAIDCREAFTRGSSVRVRDHATRLARALGLNASDQLTLERAALVRDIGKLRISNEVLLKKDVLSYDEWQLIQRHAHIGAELAASRDALKDTADIIRCHHECYDGTGYPEGLEGEAIPFLARAMKVLDVYCAMTSPRHYRKRRESHRTVIAHLRSESGKHFDPEIARAFIESKAGQSPPEEG